MTEFDNDLTPAETPDVPAEAWKMPPAHRRPRKVYGGMWGPAEVGVVAAALLVLAAAAAVYLFFTVPSDRELAKNKTENDRLEAELASARSKYGEITDTRSQVDTLVASVDDFETRFLPASVNGRSAVYQRLNALIRAYGLVNTSGPDYAPLEPIGAQERQQETEQEKGRARFRSLYPGMYITTTLEGSYQNLRRFIRDIETGREFLLISSIELAPSDTTDKPRESRTADQQPQQVQTFNPAAPPANNRMFQPGMNPAVPVQPSPDVPRSQQGRMHGQTVTLRIELAAYFRRPAAPETPAVQQ
jgi:Tfp pilus assembly protein PilO